MNRAVDVPLPPRELRFMAESDDEFQEIGDSFVADLRSFAGLSDDGSVVDIGCGYGRLAHALLRDHAFTGTYLGIDILPRHIGWCREVISPLSNGRFEFRHLDVKSDRYNPGGTLDPASVDLGVPPASADAVVLASVFTHMHARDIAHYLRLVRAMLKPKGRALATFFLMDRTWRDAERAGTSAYPLRHRVSFSCRAANPDDVLHVIAYRPWWVRSTSRRAGLRIAAPPRLGSWRTSAAGGGHFQDLVVFRRR